ncbi:menaquinone-dependent protoporphyrinogen IX dehydrogenase [Dechloromonas sp. A34]|uniref:menaquinone-dependent protoporphyrinogen IX dehydrogenase n=1 Tax=Dechloromonas sp. A34 TaxID=447588 RepID=UPI002248BC0E|nr:menaquinone-dependent protoporphyrinogen IX dehydrogenase [Dechloromonas sp. A34]
MTNILIVYSTTDGHTLAICRVLEQVVERHGLAVTLAEIGDAERLDLAAFDKIVIGASIRYGRHSQQVLDFVGRHQAMLDARPNAFFSVNIVARKPEKNRPETNPYLLKFLRQISWHPRQLAVFAGKLDYPRYRFVDRLMIRFIMLLTHGPTDPRTVVEFTDWQAVEAFGHTLAEM